MVFPMKKICQPESIRRNFAVLSGSLEPFRKNLSIGPAFVNAFRADGSLHT